MHCAAGVSRSAALCIVYLAKHCDMTVREAYLMIRHKRPMISPNIGFWRQMIAYETKLKVAIAVVVVLVSFPFVYFYNVI